MKNAFTSLFLILSLVVVCTPAFSQAPIKGGTLTVCQPAEPPGLDPTTHTAAAIDRGVYANIYEGLVKVDSRGGPTVWSTPST